MPPGNRRIYDRRTEMRFVSIALGAALLLMAAPAAADPVSGFIDNFFHYQEPPPPVGGDCAAIAAAIGPEQTWRGEFSGRRLGYYTRSVPYAARGCFESEVACRIWQQQALNYAEGRLTYMSCRRDLSY
jgi:hypothetical protein